MLLKTPNGLQEILATFGDIHDPQFELKYIQTFDLPYPLLFNRIPVARARCHRLIVDNFSAVFADILSAGLDKEATEFCGIYAVRPIRGLPKFPSLHSWGVAIDLNCSEFPLGSTKRQDDKLVKIFEKHGFFYGGDFSHRKDPMHWQFATGY
jgi:D-alanyl-D-alanine carboxypeptidase